MSEVLIAVRPSTYDRDILPVFMPSFLPLLNPFFPNSSEDHIQGWVCGHMSDDFAMLLGETSPLTFIDARKVLPGGLR